MRDDYLIDSLTFSTTETQFPAGKLRICSGNNPHKVTTFSIYLVLVIIQFECDKSHTVYLYNASLNTL